MTKADGDMSRKNGAAAQGGRSRVELIPARRHARLLEILNTRGAASIRELASDLGSSSSTVRRDLEYLAEKGALIRSFGGAAIVGPSSTFEPDADIASHFERDEKRMIGRFAAGLISPGQSVIFDSSSTVLEAAQCLVERGIAATGVTNDLRIARVLGTAERMQVVVLGGTVRPRSATLIGEAAEQQLANLHLDVALLGTHAITGDVLSETSLEVARVKRAMIAGALRTIVLADHTKFRDPAFSTICRARDIAAVITTRQADAADLAALKDAGLQVLFADGGV